MFEEKLTWESQGLFQPEIEDESADESETERLGDDAPPLAADFSSLVAFAVLLSLSAAAVNGSLGRLSPTVPPAACRRPIIGVCDKS